MQCDGLLRRRSVAHGAQLLLQVCDAPRRLALCDRRLVHHIAHQLARVSQGGGYAHTERRWLSLHLRVTGGGSGGVDGGVDGGGAAGWRRGSGCAVGASSRSGVGAGVGGDCRVGVGVGVGGVGVRVVFGGGGGGGGGGGVGGIVGGEGGGVELGLPRAEAAGRDGGRGGERGLDLRVRIRVRVRQVGLVSVGLGLGERVG